jgi:hypothetical protein
MKVITPILAAAQPWLCTPRQTATTHRKMRGTAHFQGSVALKEAARQFGHGLQQLPHR